MCVMFLPVPIALMSTVELETTWSSTGVLMMTLGGGLLFPLPASPPELPQPLATASVKIANTKANSFLRFIFLPPSSFRKILICKRPL
jgi:hypothetical protein